jgi:hypothetical protein
MQPTESNKIKCDQPFEIFFLADEKQRDQEQQ